MNDKWFETMFCIYLIIALVSALTTFGAIAFALYLVNEWIQKM